MNEHAIDEIGEEMEDASQATKSANEDGKDVADARKQLHKVVEPLS